MPNIPDSFKKAVKSERGNLFTSAGRIVYANLFVPSSPDEKDKSDAKLQWGLTLLIPDGYDLSAIEKEVDEIIDDKHKPANDTLRKKIKTPILETAGIQSLAALAEEYPYCLRLSAKAFDKNGQPRQRPGVVDKDRNKIEEKDAPQDCYDGRWARCSVRAYPWNHPTGGKGVSLGLVNVQLLWHDDAIARSNVSAEAEFEAVDIEDEVADEEAFA